MIWGGGVSSANYLIPFCDQLFSNPEARNMNLWLAWFEQNQGMNCEWIFNTVLISSGEAIILLSLSTMASMNKHNQTVIMHEMIRLEREVSNSLHSNAFRSDTRSKILDTTRRTASPFDTIGKILDTTMYIQQWVQRIACWYYISPCITVTKLEKCTNVSVYFYLHIIQESLVPKATKQIQLPKNPTK